MKSEWSSLATSEGEDYHLSAPESLALGMNFELGSRVGDSETLRGTVVLKRAREAFVGQTDNAGRPYIALYPTQHPPCLHGQVVPLMVFPFFRLRALTTWGLYPFKTNSLKGLSSRVEHVNHYTSVIPLVPLSTLQRKRGFTRVLRLVRLFITIPRNVIKLFKAHLRYFFISIEMLFLFSLRLRPRNNVAVTKWPRDGEWLLDTIYDG